VGNRPPNVYDILIVFVVKFTDEVVVVRIEVVINRGLRRRRRAIHL